MDLEADPVPEAEEEPVGQRLAGPGRPLRRVAGGLEHVARRVVGGLGRGAGTQLRERALVRLADEPVEVADRVADLADHVRPRHVRPAARRVVLRPEVEADRRVRRQRARPRLVPDGVARTHGRDDDVGRQRRAQAAAELGQPRAQALGGEDLALPLQDAVARARLAQDAGRLGERREARLGRAADPGELGVRLAAAAQVEALVVDLELHAASAQEVGDREREPGRDTRRAHAHALDRAREELELDLVAREALGDELPAAELLAEDPLDVGSGGRQAVGLQHVGEHDPAAVVLGVEERVSDGDRQLVAQLGRAQRVAVDQDVGHAATPARWRRT